MKIITFIYGFLCFGLCTTAQKPERYVWAPSGLNLRVAPNKSSYTIKKLPFGKQIMALNEVAGVDSVKETNGFYIKGQWMKVLADKDTGYVFAGYIMPWKPISYRPEKEHIQYNGGKIEKFLSAYFPSIEGKKILKYYPADHCGHSKPSQYPNECTQKYQINFQEIIFQYEHIPEKNSLINITIPNISLQTVYLWALHSTSEENGLGQTVSYKQGKINIHPDGAGCSITLFVDGLGRVIWQENCGC